ncbi:hypothetical protein ACLB1O_16915 [Escherichia coli]
MRILCSTSVRCSSLCLSTQSGWHCRFTRSVLTFQHMGITFAASILNFVVLTASLSAR